MNTTILSPIILHTLNFKRDLSLLPLTCQLIRVSKWSSKYVNQSLIPVSPPLCVKDRNPYAERRFNDWELLYAIYMHKLPFQDHPASPKSPQTGTWIHLDLEHKGKWKTPHWPYGIPCHFKYIPFLKQIGGKIGLVLLFNFYL